MSRRRERAQRTPEGPEPRLPQLIRGLLFAQLLVLPLVFSRATLESVEYPKVALLVTVALLILAAGAGALANAPRGTARAWVTSLRAQPLATSVLLLAGSAIVSTCLSLSPRTSWQGAPRSDAGLQTALAYAVLFFGTRAVCREPRHFRTLLLAPAIAATLVAGYAVLQITGLDPITWTDVAEFGGVRRVQSTMGHANFLAAYLAMSLPLLAYVAWRGVQQKRRATAVVGAAFVMLAAAVVVSTLSRAGWLALGVVLVMLAIGAVREWGWPRRSVLVLATGIAVAVGGTALLVPQGGFSAALRTRVGLVRSSSTANPRVHIWRAALGMFREDPVSGVGLDAFQIGFQRHRTVDYWRAEGHHTPDRAHSGPLHVLATQGLMGGLALLALVLASVRASRRALSRHGSESALLWAAVTGLVAFAVQDLFSLTVAGVGTLAVTLLALLSRLGEETTAPIAGRAETDRECDRGDAKFLAAVAASLAAAAIWVLVVLPWRANTAVARAHWLKDRSPAAALLELESATRLQPGQAMYWAELSVALQSTAAHVARGPVRSAMLERARAALSRARDLVPADAYTHANLGRLLADLANEQPPLATASEVYDAFEGALARDPRNLFLVAEAARAAMSLNDLDRTRALAERGQALGVSYAPLTWELGYVHLSRGMAAGGSGPRDAAARAELGTAAALLARAVDEPWLGDANGQVVALSQLAAARIALGEFEEARAPAERAIALSPSFTTPRFNLAKIYEHLGQPDRARAEYRRILELEPGHAPARQALHALEAREAASASYR